MAADLVAACEPMPERMLHLGLLYTARADSINAMAGCFAHFVAAL